MGQESDRERQPEVTAPGNPSDALSSPPDSSDSDGEHNGDSPEAQNLVEEPEAHPAPEEQAASEEQPPERRRRSWRKWVWLTAALFAILAIFIIYHLRSAAEQKSAAAKANHVAPAAITAEQSTTGNMPMYVDALGTVTPLSTITLYSQITGQIVDVHYQEGQIVNKGAPLIEIDPRPYESTLTQAQGNLEHDEGVLAQARMDLKRYQAAFERNAIARQQLEDQQQAVVQDEGSVKADQGTVAYDQVQLSYCHIVSPITGRVGLRLVDPGNTVFAGSGSTLVVITQLQPITIVFDVSENDLPQVEAQLRSGHTLSVAAFDRSFDHKIESGTLTSLDNEVDTTTGTVKFRARFPNQNLKLYPNQFVNAQLLLKTLRNVTLVPSAAVQYNGTTSFVYVIQPGKAPPAPKTPSKAAPKTAPQVPPSTVAVQDVKVLTGNDQETAVQGLNPGVTVATSGFDRLENGVPVTIRSQPSQVNNQGHGSNSSSGGSLTGGSVSSTGP